MTPAAARLRFAAGAALLLALVAYFGWQSIVDVVLRMSPLWLLVATTLISAASLVSAYSRHLFINIEHRLTFREFLPIYWASWATGLLFPGQVGDVVAMSAMMRKHGMRVHQSLGRSLLDKLISFAIVGGIGLIGFARQLVGADYSLLAASGHTYVVLAVIAGAAACALAAPGVRDRLMAGIRIAWHFMAEALAEGRRTAAVYPKRVALNCCLSLLSFLMLGMSYWSVFRGLGYLDVSVPSTIAAVAACSLIAYVPISFNGIGTAEVGGVFFFGQLGIAGTAVVSAFICLRLIVYAVAWIPAGLALFLTARDTGTNQ